MGVIEQLKKWIPLGTPTRWTRALVSIAYVDDRTIAAVHT
jgi:hypothetical protein